MLHDPPELERGYQPDEEPWPYDPYVAIREVVADEWRDLAPEGIEQLLGEALGEVAPQGLETFLRDVRQVGGALARAVPTILPQAVQGGAVGSVLGPAGTIGGAILGGLSAAAQRPGQPAQPSASPSSAPEPSGTPSPVIPSAAAQLLEVLFRPEVAEALLAMAMGQHGRREVQVGDTAIPVAAIANLLTVLAGQAASQYNAAVPAATQPAPDYLRDAEGAWVVDPAEPTQRAGVVLTALRQAEWAAPSPTAEAELAWPGPDEDDLEEPYWGPGPAEMYGPYESWWG